MIPEQIQKAFLQFLSEHFSKPVGLHSVLPLSGGSINEAFRLETSVGAFFVKFNHASAYPGMFAKEAKGLQILRKAAEIRIPEVIHQAETADFSFLILEFIREGFLKKDFWDFFGRRLADLHRHTDTAFGLDHDNYMGSLIQRNRQHSDWISFFIEERLEPQLKLAREKGAVSVQLIRQAESMYRYLEEIIPVEKPALIHGDLWNGNWLAGDAGNPCLIDPAVYYGHREVDLSMTRLFGGFPADFYEAYREAFPLEKGWEKRTDIFNLYPLLIHVNLFGGGYIAQVKLILGNF
jgi:fructosamine-3-kinase